MHAESDSVTEAMRGPLKMVYHGFLVLGFTASDACEQYIAKATNGLADRNTAIYMTSSLVKKTKMIEVCCHRSSAHLAPNAYRLLTTTASSRPSPAIAA